MPVTMSEFWSLAEKSRILQPDVCDDLRQRWQAFKGADRATSARTLAEWLVAEGRLTRYQARLLLAGQPGPFYFGEYLILKRLRHGGLEDCFHAVHAPTRCPVTLRFVRGTAFEPTTQAEEIRRVLEQAPRTEGVLVPFYEWVDCGAYQFGVFGHLDGRPVSEILAERGKLDAAAACRIIRDASLGIAPLHVAGASHAALRPESIWLAHEHRVSVLPRQLCDRWDALQGRKSWLTAGGDAAALAVAQFTAPEAAGRSAVATPASDVYSLGCILYLLLCGHPPFSGTNVADVLQQHATEPLPPLSPRRVPDSVRRLLERMLAKDITARPADARELAAALIEASATESRAAADGRLRADGPEAARRSAYRDWIGRRLTMFSGGAGRDAAAPAVAPRATVAAMPDVSPLPVAQPVQSGGESLPVAAPAGDVARLRPQAPGSLPPQPTTPIEPPVDFFGMHVDAAKPSNGAAIPVPAAGGAVMTRLPRKRRLDWVTLGISLAIAAVAAGGVLVWHWSRGETTPAVPDGTSGVAATGGRNSADGGATSGDISANATATRERRVPDDGQTLWASPTSGPPIPTAFLPDGTEGILSVRPADLLSHPQGEQVLAALGPQLASLMAELRPSTGFAPEEITHLVIGWQGGEPLGAGNLYLVLRPNGEEPISTALLQQRIAGASAVLVEGQAAVVRGETAYYPAAYPASAGGRTVLVVCPRADLPEIVSRAGAAPLLMREMEQLLAASDADRHVTLLLPPRLLLGDGRDFLAGHAALLRDPLHWFVGEATQAVLLSGHWGDDFFVELQAIATAEVPPWDLRDGLEERLAELPTLVGNRVLTADLQPYGLRVVGRLPEMLRRLAGYTRSEVEGDRAVLRCYLPAPAGHNLLMASEILLAELHAADSPRPSAPPAHEPESLEDRLAQVTSLSFSRDTLEAAVATLAADVGAPIEIRGQDLKLEGITKNQSFGIDVRDRPAREILVEILRLANPDKTAESANDPRQKLIFTIEPDETGAEAVYVTTRSAAEDRGATVPPEFATDR